MNVRFWYRSRVLPGMPKVRAKGAAALPSRGRWNCSSTGSISLRWPGFAATRNEGTSMSTSSIIRSIVMKTFAIPSRSFGNRCAHDVGCGRHLRRELHRLAGEDAAVVVLVGDHLDALVELQALEHLARLLAEPVGQEDVAAVVPVEAVLAEAVRVAAVVRLLLREHRAQAVLRERRRAREAGGAGPEDDRVVVRLGGHYDFPFASMWRISSAARAAAVLSSS